MAKVLTILFKKTEPLFCSSQIQTSNDSIAKQMHVNVERRKITALQLHLLKKNLLRNGMPAFPKFRKRKKMLLISCILDSCL